MSRRFSPAFALVMLGLVLALVLPTAAGATTPDVTTFDSYSTGATTATVEGIVDPNGQATTYAVQYDLASSTWCTTGGTSGSPAHTTASIALGYTASGNYFVSVDLTGLVDATKYCAQLGATNASGQGAGGQVEWTQGAPGVDTFDAFSTDDVDAAVEGDVNPAGKSTTYRVEYGPANSLWCTSGGASGSPASTTSATSGSLDYTDPAFQDVYVSLNGLTTGADYCAELTAANASGETDGGQVTWTQGAPGAYTYQAYSTGATTARIFGGINPMDQVTNYQVAYDVASSTWCTSGGASGSPANRTVASQYYYSNNQVDYVSVDLPPLTEKTGYCAAMEATNASGTTYGTQLQWIQGAATAYTTEAFAQDATTASVFGDVNPAGLATTYKAEYGLDSSDWCASGGLVGSPAHTTAPTALDPTDDTFHGVSVTLTGLTEGANYCAELVAVNADGESDGVQMEWTQTAPPPPPPDLIVNVTGAGTVTSYPAGIDCGNGATKCAASIALNQPVTLTATPAAGARFWSWSGALSCGASPTCSFTLNNTTTIGATFKALPTLPTHTLTLSRAGSGSGTVTSSPAGIDCGTTCSFAFGAGLHVTLTATSAPGSTFSGWSGGGCSGTGTCVATMTADQTVTATFTRNPSPPPAPGCRVPKVKGKKLTAARTAIRHAHCGVGKITRAFSARVQSGRVVSQKPAPGTRHPAGTRVRLVVSKGRKPA